MVRTGTKTPFQPLSGLERQEGALGSGREGHGVNSLPLPFPMPGLLLGVPDGDFQHQLWRDLEELRVVAIGLEQERQDIKAASWGFPALLYADLQAKPPGQTTEPQALQRQQRRGEGQRSQGPPPQRPPPLEAPGQATSFMKFSLTSSRN